MVDTIIEVDNVSMRFRMANDRISSLKEFAVRAIKKRIEYTDFEALKNVTFDVKKGEVIGIIGHNGAGKSTLLKVISGILKPTEGQVKVFGNIAPMLELGSGFDFDMTGKENIFLNGAILGYSEEYLNSKYDEIVSFSEIGQFIDIPIRNYSSGMVARLAFSIASLVQPDVLILDEVLSVGDGAFQDKSAKKMKEIIHGGATTILVSHSIGQVRKLCSKVLWLNQGKCIAYGTDVQGICDAYEEFLSCGELPSKEKDEKWKNELYTPTMIRHLGEYWFIIDCWHHRILYNKNFSRDINDWFVLIDTLYYPHSIDYDGELYMCDDTGNKRLLIWKENDCNQLELTQTIKLSSITPNIVQYCNDLEMFFVNGSNEAKILALKKNNGQVKITKEFYLPDYKGKYFRSFNIIDGYLYVISGPGYISQYELVNGELRIIARYSVPDELCGMNYIEKIDNYFYISVYQDINGNISPKFVRVKDLEDLKFRKYEDLYEKFAFHGVPYYITKDGEWLYITEIDNFNSIKRFRIIDDEIVSIETLLSFKKPSYSSRMRRRSVYTANHA